MDHKCLTPNEIIEFRHLECVLLECALVKLKKRSLSFSLSLSNKLFEERFAQDEAGLRGGREPGRLRPGFP